MKNKHTQRIRTIIFVTALAGLLLSQSATAALFLKFDGIDGESQDQNHEKWIDILAVNWGISVATTNNGPGREIGKPNFSDLSWNQTQDKSFPTLFSNISLGKIIPKADIDFTTEGFEEQRVYFKLQFEKVLLTSLNLSASGEGLPAISGSFAYDKVNVTFIPQDNTGKELSPIKASYDLSTQKGNAAAVADLFAQGLNGPVVSAVPLPGAFWLFGSLLPYLIHRARRKPNDS